MRSIVVTTALSFFACVSSLLAAEPPVACTLLTQAQIGAATAATVGAGSPLAAPTSCQRSGQGKIVTLTINRPRGGKSPEQQFTDGKARKLPGVTTESISGVGEDAYYVYF